MTDVQSRELQLVNEELSQIENEIESLLQRQHKLLKRKTLLEHRFVRSENEQLPDFREWEKTDFKWSAEVEELRSSVFHLEEFRPLQLQTINATFSKKDVIVIMATGGGKSLCYQLPAMLSKGTTLVVSPLVSLMEDQLMGLKKLGIVAHMLTASSTKEEVNAIQNAMTGTQATDRMRLLYVTPEKLAKSKRFLSKLEKMYSIGLLERIAIDEVHCCSQWGHDFRPDYKFLGVLKRQFPNAPILGLTATATQDVIDDVKKMLDIPSALVFRAPLNRSNLFYEVHPKPSSLSSSVDKISEFVTTRFKDQSGIIYCLTQKDAEEVARELDVRGFRVGCYHANLDLHHRSRVHTLWTNNKIQMIVATIAFGMGIDKPDVRFVIHHSVSKSVENYYQESGRAGRDGERSHCVLFFSFSDLFRQSTMVFTEQSGLEKLYAMMLYATDLQKCRRSILSQQFGETWESKDCREMCDHCNPIYKGSVVTKDVTQYCRDVVSLLSHAVKTNQRVTSLKLIDAWSGKGSPSLRLAIVAPPKLPRLEMERVVVMMLLNGYLKEDFHFTPYSTISYIVSGSRAKILESPGHSVEMELLVSESSSVKRKTCAVNAKESHETNLSGAALGSQKIRNSASTDLKEKKCSDKQIASTTAKDEQKRINSDSGARNKDRTISTKTKRIRLENKDMDGATLVQGSTESIVIDDN